MNVCKYFKVHVALPILKQLQNTITVVEFNAVYSFLSDRQQDTDC